MTHWENRKFTCRLEAVLLWAALISLSVSFAQGQLAHKGPVAAIALSQTLSPYDVSSVRQNKSEDQFRITVGDGGFTATSAPLKTILQDVYDINPDRITGLTGPVASLNFDVTAKVLPSADGTRPQLSDLQLSAMMIPLLADRFHLRAHVETKVAPVYDLVVAKSGTKLKLDQFEPAEDALNINFSWSGTDRIFTGKSASINNLADVLSDISGRKVINKTGLTGHTNITLKWADDVATTQGGLNLVSIFTAVEEQLGLKLQPSKGPVDKLVIDHVEMPSEN